MLSRKLIFRAGSFSLAVSSANQRVLLHRGRSQLRQALETALGEC
jgi:hypothetical protein